jgi:2',3'-cyclic-nucleotide 2'-phosphodiesterase (5'-nucleotidase family)
MRRILLVVGWISSAALLGGCTSTPPRTGTDGAATVKKEGVLTLLYQSNRNGWLEPCGCHSKPYGGLDREANAVEAARATKRPILYVDAGNIFAAKVKEPLPEVRRKRLAARAERLAGALDTLGLDVVSPGSGDLALGLPVLRAIALKSKFAWVSSNLWSPAGTPIFSPYVVLERGGIRYAVLALTEPLPEAIAKSDELTVASPADALNRFLPEALSRADIVILLSQLDARSNEKLSSAYPAVKIIVGADPDFAFDAPVYLNAGHTLLVDPVNNGFLLGRLDVDFKLPFIGFHSPEVAKKNQERLARLEAQQSKEPSKELANVIRRIRERDSLDLFVPGASRYSGELVKLSVEAFGKPNALTRWLKEEKQRIREEGRAPSVRK